jgi:hypothetical protein
LSHFLFTLLKFRIYRCHPVELIIQKFVTKLSQIWDLGSGIRDPGSRGQKGTGSRIRIRNTGYRYGTVDENLGCSLRPFTSAFQI